MKPKGSTKTRAGSRKKRGSAAPPRRAVWLPSNGLEDGEELDFDPTAYDCLERFSTEWPCLSFDILPDSLGGSRTSFPHNAMLVAGTQADSPGNNFLAVIKLANIRKLSSIQESDSDAEEEQDDDDDGDDEKMGEAGSTDTAAGKVETQLHYRRVRHAGGINRVRSMPQRPGIVAGWSDRGVVEVWDLTEVAQEVSQEELPIPRISNRMQNSKPTFVQEHASEGFAIDWSKVKPGQLASGDGLSNIHVWSPQDGGWSVSAAFPGHTSSIEDIQWSPTEDTVFASGSADKTIRIWDTRSPTGAMISVNAHKADVNVLSWSHLVTNMLASGADDGTIHIWDLRKMTEQGQVALFNFHKDAITSVEWSPHEGSMLAASSADNQLAVLDLAVERDPEEEAQLAPSGNALAPDNVPPQLMFLHCGQENMKELHWHGQIPGLIACTAADGFNFFKAANI
eukprot:evm.model.scf_285EXC.1 EVM.evm.TU.scf_285EXC.1   scf_285EXC:4320-9246(-)